MAAKDFPKANTQDLLRHVDAYGKTVTPMDLGVTKALAIVTCMDSRVMPAQMFGLKFGEAEYIRNAGGRVTPDVIRSLLVAIELLHCKTIFVIHHTDCGGQAAVKHADLLESKVAELGRIQAGSSWLSSWVETLSFGLLSRATDLAALYPIKPPDNHGLHISVKDDVEKLKASALINPSVEIRGFIYDTHQGKLEEIASYMP